MKKILLVLITAIILFSGITTVYSEELNLNAPTYILIDPVTGQVLYQHNPDLQWFPASTTKIMTAILAIESGNLDKMVTANNNNIDPGPGGANVGIMADESLSVRDLLHALLIKSANETANILADNICPTRQDFVDLMNKRAAELGATHTHFVTTNGMHDPNHYTTVSDMAKIAQHAMTLPEFREIVHKKEYQMTPTNKHPTWDKIYTTNRLMYYTSPYFNEVTGIKTGYTKQADNNLVSSAKDKNGMELLAVVYGVKYSGNADTNVYGTSRTLLEYGFKNFAKQKIIGANEVIQSVPVADATDNSNLDLVTASDFTCVLPINASDWNLEKNIQYNSTSYSAPISKGQVVGTIEYKRNGTLLGTVNIIASRAVEKSMKAAITDKTSHILGNKIVRSLLLGAVVLVVAFFLLRRILRKASRAVNSKRQEN